MDPGKENFDSLLHSHEPITAIARRKVIQNIGEK